MLIAAEKENFNWNFVRIFEFENFEFQKVKLLVSKVKNFNFES